MVGVKRIDEIYDYRRADRRRRHGGYQTDEIAEAEEPPGKIVKAKSGQQEEIQAQLKRNIKSEMNHVFNRDLPIETDPESQIRRTNNNDGVGDKKENPSFKFRGF